MKMLDRFSALFSAPINWKTFFCVFCVFASKRAAKLHSEESNVAHCKSFQLLLRLFAVCSLDKALVPNSNQLRSNETLKISTINKKLVKVIPGEAEIRLGNAIEREHKGALS